MRPPVLDPLFSSIRSLTGVGPKIARMLAKVLDVDMATGEPWLIDLLQLMPHSSIDRRNRVTVADAQEGAIATLELTVGRHQPPLPGKRNIPYRVFAHDTSGSITLVFFHAQASWLQGQLPVGGQVIVSGKVECFNGQPSMVHPDHITTVADSAALPLVEPVYPSTAGLSAKTVARAMLEALTHIPALPEWQEKHFHQREDFPAYAQALARIHAPQDPADIALTTPARRRLAYDELLAGQLALALVRLKTRRLSGRALPLHGTCTNRLRDSLPFRLTQGQEQAIDEISTDLAAPERMLRLLQGDVGAGKTVVALLAMAQAAESEGQSALMAPTEVLARQHFATIAPLAEKAGLQTALLTGREKGCERERILASLQQGQIHIIIGTHALIQEGVEFRNLALAIIDEQHRFGVHQRLQLTGKGNAPDMLVMTATPIPRTLVLTAFGDMDVSRLTEKPAGRKPIKTATLPAERMEELLTRISHALSAGEKLYWICPLVEESENSDLTAATERFEVLTQRFGDMVGLVHGKMPAAQKDVAMADFKTGKTRLLVATTVVEVGVDVPDASIIVIEHSERFGLAQLHQLRGRVGRSDKPSSCTLLYKEPLSATARARLNVMRETEDGFVIAEEDLRLRGEGDLLGTKQSGVPGFHLADIEAHRDLLETARRDARLILEQDSELESPRGQALRLLLYLFRRDDAIRLLRAG
ncbi:MAG: ATP-dependent DNA helicase RecG [Candidatus Tokpelaia hoelldobleri]|uniref:ATP-dependent DNA helicase RecG n=1 Tax=Candidatus Tokpelaia hoelldobleri TaxID=1902579 RepID=A0A1U9JU22_9HYPH|nr:MAG: ATP-dependent DNA helicase RecG [Candidatus Tokpelaia hoelldoblerii]